MDKKTFCKRYGMAICESCNSQGYIQNPERKCCPKCGGFEFVKTEPEEDMHTSPIIGKGKGDIPL